MRVPKGGAEALSTHSFEQWRVRWGAHIDYFATEHLARLFDPGEPSVIETRLAVVEYTPWENLDDVARLYWRDGSRVHLLGGTERFLCGVKNGEHFMRVGKAAEDQLCGNCLRRL
jgi:hypothetical protein